MPDTDPAVDPHITVRECVRQRELCQKAIRDELHSGLEGYTSRIETAAIEQKRTADKMLVKVTQVDERGKSNTHRLNWAGRILAGVVVVLLAGAIIGGLLAWKHFGG